MTGRQTISGAGSVVLQHVAACDECRAREHWLQSAQDDLSFWQAVVDFDNTEHIVDVTDQQALTLSARTVGRAEMLLRVHRGKHERAS